MKHLPGKVPSAVVIFAMLCNSVITSGPRDVMPLLYRHWLPMTGPVHLDDRPVGISFDRLCYIFHKVGGLNNVWRCDCREAVALPSRFSLIDLNVVSRNAGCVSSGRTDRVRKLGGAVNATSSGSVSSL